MLQYIGKVTEKDEGVKMANVKTTGKRVCLLDEIRGLAIICMVVYHTMYDLKYIFGVDVPIFFDSRFDIIRNIFAGLFIFISGAVCRFSRNNLKRGVQCFFLGMVITFVTPFFAEGFVWFGILHFLGISMMLFGLGEKLFDVLPALVGVLIFGLLFALTLNVPRLTADQYGNITAYGFFGLKGIFEWELPAAAYNEALFPLGLHSPGFGSSDYFPLMPWFFLFAAGSYFGIWAKDGALPKFFYDKHIGWLGTVGQHTIWIYMLHQPVVFGICSLIFR